MTPLNESTSPLYTRAVDLLERIQDRFCKAKVSEDVSSEEDWLIKEVAEFKHFARQDCSTSLDKAGVKAITPESQPVPDLSKLEADMRAIKDAANEMASADVPEGYSELEDTTVADACLQHGFDCMATAVLNWIHDQRNNK